jgi:hypothetical protein
MPVMKTDPGRGVNHPGDFRLLNAGFLGEMTRVSQSRGSTAAGAKIQEMYSSQLPGPSSTGGARYTPAKMLAVRISANHD